MCQSCNRDNEIAILRMALKNLLEVALKIDDDAYLDACKRTGIYKPCDVAVKALENINQ